MLRSLAAKGTQMRMGESSILHDAPDPGQQAHHTSACCCILHLSQSDGLTRSPLILSLAPLLWETLVEKVADSSHNSTSDGVGLASQVRHEQADVHQDQLGQPAALLSKSPHPLKA